MSEMRDWLAISAAWRIASLIFAAPSPQSREELRDLAALQSPGPAALVSEFVSAPYEEWEAEFHRVLGPAGCPACQSSYEENALAGRGPVLALIAGYYEAFAYRPDPEAAETPDRISVELGFLSYLALKIAFAAHENRAEEKDIARAAYMKFLEEHPRYWLGKFSERLEEYQSPLYAPAARWLLELPHSSPA